jgi:hypothetical protein
MIPYDSYPRRKKSQIILNSAVKYLKNPPIEWVPAVPFPGIKWPGTEINHLRLSNAEVKNTWSHTSAPSTCPYGLDRVSFTFTITVKGYYYAYHLL